MVCNKILLYKCTVHVLETDWKNQACNYREKKRLNLRMNQFQQQHLDLPDYQDFDEVLKKQMFQ